MIVRNLKCDKCGRTFRDHIERARTGTVYMLRKLAWVNGWTREGKEDLCRSCSQEQPHD